MTLNNSRKRLFPFCNFLVRMVCHSPVVTASHYKGRPPNKQTFPHLALPKQPEASKGSAAIHQEPLNGPFLNGLFSKIYFRENGLIRHLGQHLIEVGKRPTTELKRPLKANGLFSGTPP